MKLTEQLIDDIRREASITQVIGKYIPLTKKGKGYTALCPFHDDHDPSLSISEDKQIYKCFVCGNGGNVFTFVMNYKHLSFPEAVAEVASIIGKPIELETRPKPVSPYQRLYDVMNEATEVTHYFLQAKGSAEAREYLEKRGITEEIANRFRIGYNPGGDTLCKYLSSKNYKDEEIIKTNLGRLAGSELKDVFSQRITFPICDKDGNTVAFTARDFKGLSDSKYINSSETVIYTKGNILYNYHRAANYVKDANRVILCEGVMDVIAFERAGISFAVATLGTACSKNQLKLLKELSNNLVLAYDGDRAGQNAIYKTGLQAMENGMKVTVIDNQTGLDPDEIVNQYKEKGLRDLAGKAIPFMDFIFNYYKKNLNLENYSDRKEMTIRVGEIIDKLTDEYDRVNYSEELYRLTNIRKIDSVQQKSEYNNKIVSKPVFSLDGLTKAEYTILQLTAKSKRGMEIYKQELGSLLNPVNQKLEILISEDMRRHDNVSFSRIYNVTDDTQIQNLIGDLSLMENLPEEYDEELLRGAIGKVKEEMNRRRMKQLKEKIAAVKDLDEKETNRLMREYEEIIKDLAKR